jgi:hypothetical protein
MTASDSESDPAQFCLSIQEGASRMGLLTTDGADEHDVEKES